MNGDDVIAGYALAIDLTARDLQAKSKKAGLPWTRAKGYDTFLPISDFIPKNKGTGYKKLQQEILQINSLLLLYNKIVKDPYELELYLQVNGEDRYTFCMQEI